MSNIVNLADFRRKKDLERIEQIMGSFPLILPTSFTIEYPSIEEEIGFSRFSTWKDIEISFKEDKESSISEYFKSTITEQKEKGEEENDI